MFYVYRLDIPANTAKADAERITCKLTHGFVRRVSVSFPPGPMGLAHVVIYRYEHQVWPTNPDESFAWDNVTIEFEEEFDLTERPHTLSIRGWNEDDTYSHEVTVRFEVGGEEWGLAELLALQGQYTVLEE